MDVLLSMPLVLANIARFFLYCSNNIRRDFFELVLMSHKERYARKTLEKFNRELGEQDFSGIEIFFDGFENFSNGVPLFSLVGISREYFIVFDPLLSMFFWKEREFMINNVVARPMLQDPKRVKALSSIPMSLGTSWLLAGLIDEFFLDLPPPFLLPTNLVLENDRLTRKNR